MAIVANTDNHKQAGSHWVSFYVDDNGQGVYFDSYGLPPLISNFQRGLRKNCTSYRWNSKTIQSSSSKFCGEYCIMFLYYMSRNYKLEEFCALFSRNRKKNDILVKSMFDNLKRRFKIRFTHKNNKYSVGSGRLICIQNCTSFLL